MLQAGQRLNDYKIISFLANGGMGEIYLAEEVALSRQVVIKVVRPEALLIGLITFNSLLLG